MKIDWMLIVLVSVLALIAFSFWRAHKNPNFAFNALDLVMEDGKVSKISVAFMLVLGVTTWLMIDLQIKGKMSEGYMTTYGSLWVIPLVARVVFNKGDGTTTTTTSVMQSTVESK